jgi:hypothetical protein
MAQDLEERAECLYLVRGFERLARQFEQDMAVKKTSNDGCLATVTRDETDF